jgi:hypothetical protein
MTDTMISQNIDLSFWVILSKTSYTYCDFLTEAEETVE